MGLLTILNVSELRALVVMEKGYLAGQTTTKPGAVFTAGDYETIDYTLLKRDPTGGVSSPYQRVPIGSYSLQMGLYRTSDRSELSFNDVWTPDAIGNKYTGVFNLNTPAIAALFAAQSADVPCTLEIQTKDGSTAQPIRVYYNPNVTLRKGLITAVSATVAAPEVAATQGWVKSNFLSKNWPKGLTWIARDQTTGQPFLCYFGDDQTIHADPIPAPWPADPIP